ncbi:ClpXP adapter SpxH family protein [Tenacibaculum caenipelagi]|uniref:Putative DsbA family dithiol-disulfide isomerase n=1 Tax=Tenacibaculum caenipelagi TaxID=1325435 RepID=A0A4R6TJZ1_9FLAO|nr:ClpXP adapter SpxH family protein [Tenacibaculum caenipelagi]TDQ29777.1 putative DsbA family dithiol-disulfide isomerase [Tenacibaculum caenipelagi]
MNEQTSNVNPLLCDPQTGMCEVTTNETKTPTEKKEQPSKNKIKVVYFTDPICSSCWGIEPQLRKLKLEYGQDIKIDYRMGGLLPDWSYNSGGISKPSDVAHHWDEVSTYYDMPIDGDVWLEDPLDSSYPPSIAFKAAQLQDKNKAILFLREIREMVFLKKKNIAKWEHIATAAKNVGLNVDLLKTDYEGKAKLLFEEDLKLARIYRVRGFPTMYFEDNSGNQEIVYGSKAYAFYEMVILKIQPTISKSEYAKDWKTLFTKYNSLTAREFSELSGIPRSQSEQLLNNLTKKEYLEKIATKNGAMWKIKKSNF